MSLEQGITPAQARKYLESVLSSFPQLNSNLQQLSSFWERKLWHQLTDALFVFLDEPAFRESRILGEFYNNFVREFEHRINPLRLTYLLLRVAHELPDRAARIAFLEGGLNKVKQDKESELLLKSVIGLNRLSEGQDIAKEFDALSSEFAAVEGVAAVVHENYYRLALQFYRAKQAADKFYDNALLYLAHSDLENVPLPEQQELALDLALASLSGENIFSFGELLSHPVLNSLRNTPHAWMIDYLTSFNSGNITEWNSVSQRFASQIAQHPALSDANQLREKISVLAFMELIFHSNRRALNFTEIGAATQLPPLQVELLVMKALSINLVKAKIDQLTETVYVSWVKPRVLSMDQIKQLKNRMDDWIKSVNSTQLFLAGETHEFQDLAY